MPLLIEKTLRGGIASPPLLPPRTDALKLCKTKLLNLLDDRAAADTLDRLCRDEPRILALVAGIVAHSPFLTRIIRRHPDWLIDSLNDNPDDFFAGLLARIPPAIAAAPTLDQAMVVLRQFRQAVALHVALADLAGVWPVERVVGALSDFADLAVDMALRLALREAERTGRLALADAFANPDRSGICILAMGKHGAHELNYSSDIDLIVLFDPLVTPVAEGREALDEVVRIIKAVVKVLHEQTGGGYVSGRISACGRTRPQRPSPCPSNGPSATTRLWGRTGSGRR